MLSSKLIRLIESHHEQIAARVHRRFHQEASTLGLGAYPDRELRRVCRDILCRLGDMLVARHAELAEHYEQAGRTGFEDGIPLHEIVHAFQIVHEEMVQYVRDEGLAETTLEMYAQEELERSADHLFDTIVFHVVRGYVRAMRSRMSAAAGRTGRAM